VNGDIMFNMAKEEMAERHQRAARRALAREARRAARARRSAARTQAAVSVPAIPDYAQELLDRAAIGSVPAPREASAQGGHARSAC
jgi:hypothetical protein